MKRVGVWVMLAVAAIVTMNCSKNVNAEEDNREDWINLALADDARLGYGGTRAAIPWDESTDLLISFDSNNIIDKEYWERYHEVAWPLQDFMIKQVKEAMGPDLWRCYRNHYMYTSIKEVSITADKSIFGEKPGEELSDKFDILVLQFVFDMEGNLIQHSAPTGFVRFSVEEWVAGNYMCPYGFNLIPKAGVQLADYQQFVTYTATVVLANGLERSCTFTVEYKNKD